MRSILAIPIVLAAVAAGCHTPPPLVPTKPPVPLTLFRADNEDLQVVVTALNARLEGTYPKGPTVNYAAVTVEEAQIAVGCGDETPECWSAIADPIPTSALLLAQVKPEGQKGVRISLRLFDAGGQKTLRLTERVFDSVSDAVDGVPDVVSALTAPQGEQP